MIVKRDIFPDLFLHLKGFSKTVMPKIGSCELSLTNEQLPYATNAQ